MELAGLLLEAELQLLSRLCLFLFLLPSEAVLDAFLGLLEQLHLRLVTGFLVGQLLGEPVDLCLLLRNQLFHSQSPLLNLLLVVRFEPLYQLLDCINELEALRGRLASSIWVLPRFTLLIENSLPHRLDLRLLGM